MDPKEFKINAGAVLSVDSFRAISINNIHLSGWMTCGKLSVGCMLE
jgi:hypothetical protein